MAINHKYVDPNVGADINAGNAPGVGNAYATMQKALDDIADGGAGNQINLCSSAAEVLAAELDFDDYTPTNSFDNPLIIRGYTTAADDGGVGEIDGNNAIAQIFEDTPPSYIILIDLKLHNTTGSVVDMPNDAAAIRCEFYNGGGTNTVDYGGRCLVIGNNVHTGTAGAIGITISGNSVVSFNRVTGHDDQAIHLGASNTFCTHNLIHNVEDNGIEYGGSDALFIYANTVVGDASAGMYGIKGNANGEWVVVLSNILKGFGSGGTGAAADFVAGGSQLMLGYNNLHGNDDDAYDNKTVFGLDLTANDTTTDPTFTNAGGNDYSVGTNAKEDGYPDTSAWPGASTNGYTEPGAVQRQEAGGGGGLLTHPGMTGGVRG